MQVLCALSYLKDDFLCTFFRESIVSLSDVVEEVFASHELKDYEVVLTAFEQVQELDDVGMLAHLEHFDLASLLEDLNRLHVSLVDGLDSDLFSGPFVFSQLDHTELTFSKAALEIVKFICITLIYHFPNALDPQLLLLN